MGKWAFYNTKKLEILSRHKWLFLLWIFQGSSLLYNGSAKWSSQPTAVPTEQAGEQVLVCAFSFTSWCNHLLSLLPNSSDHKPRTEVLPWQMCPQPTKLGIYVTENPAWLDSNWMNVSNTLDVYPMFPQQLLNVTVFCQNSDCEQEHRIGIRLCLMSLHTDMLFGLANGGLGPATLPGPLSLPPLNTHGAYLLSALMCTSRNCLQ